MNKYEEWLFSDFDCILLLKSNSSFFVPELMDFSRNFAIFVRCWQFWISRNFMKICIQHFVRKLLTNVHLSTVEDSKRFKNYFTTSSRTTSNVSSSSTKTRSSWYCIRFENVARLSDVLFANYAPSSSLAKCWFVLGGAAYVDLG